MIKTRKALVIGWVLLGVLGTPALPATDAAAGKSIPQSTPSAVKSTRTLKSADLAKLMRVMAYEKSTGAVSKVKGVFKKSSRTVTVKCTFTNKSKKTVRAVRGWLRFATFFNESIYDLSLEAVMPIEPGEEAGMDWKLKPENFESPEAFEKFRSTPLEDMKQIWVPMVIVFEDGTTLQTTNK